LTGGVTIVTIGGIEREQLEMAFFTSIWNGKGDADGFVYFTKDNGEIVGRPYVEKRVAAGLGRWRDLYTVDARRLALHATTGSDAWLRQRNQQTVSSLIRDAESVLLGTSE
jgi:hypothetical protein